MISDTPTKFSHHDRYPASEKLEIIRTDEGSHLPTRKTLDMLGIPRTTFYRPLRLVMVVMRGSQVIGLP